jgi:hypothetical protein
MNLHDRVRELFLKKRMGRIRQGPARAREKEKRATMKNIAFLVYVVIVVVALPSLRAEQSNMMTKTHAARAGSLSNSNCGRPCFGLCAIYASRPCVKNSQTYL